MISKIVKSLERFSPEVRQASTGTFYIKLTGSKVKQIRVADHPGQKTSRNCWELRSDAQNQRRKDGRIYSFKSVNQLIIDIK